MRSMTRTAAAGLAFLVLAGGASAQTMSEAPDHHEPLFGYVLVDQLEYRSREGADAVAWDIQASYGGDYHKILLESEGEYQEDSFEEAEVQLLYSRLISHFWDFQAGIRHDIRPDPSRTYGAVGVEGLAPGFFEVDLKWFVSTEGEVLARVEAEHDLLITQRLVLQPRAEIHLAAQDVPELGIGSGLSEVEFGARLRYELARELAPYVGVAWERKLGDTAELARDEGEDVDTLSLIAGVRLWF